MAKKKQANAAAAESTAGAAPPARGARSQAVRDFLGANPQAPVKAVIEALKSQGVDVSTALVGSIKYGKGAAQKSSSPATTPKAARPSADSNGLSANDLFEAKALADKLGGLDQARKALETLAQLR